MRSSLVLVLFIIAGIFIFAQTPLLADVPKKFAFQGRILDDKGIPVNKKNVNFTFTFYDVETGGTAIDKIEVNNINITNGLYGAILNLENEEKIKSSINDDKELYISVKYNDGSELLGRTPLTSSPYALNVADGVITSSKIATDTIVDGNISPNASIALSKLANGVELTSNKTSDIETSSNSTKMYPSAKGVVDYTTTTIAQSTGAYAVGAGTALSLDPNLGYTMNNLTVTSTSSFTSMAKFSLVDITSSVTIGSAIVSYGDFDGSNSGVYGLITSTNIKVNGGIVADNTSISAADLAEIYPSTDMLEPGEVVVISDSRDGYIERSKIADNTKVAGVVSTEPGIVLNSSEKGYKLALVGKVPVNVSNENGDIKHGDLLVASSSPGHAMRALSPRPGTVIGKALENSKGARSKIMVLVNLQ
ncbi:MAG: hypothetical protein LBU09_00770 [Endomicrobium sp.]|nr:hypothetical protein [Endomicrobium sp.]